MTNTRSDIETLVRLVVEKAPYTNTEQEAAAIETTVDAIISLVTAHSASLAAAAMGRAGAGKSSERKSVSSRENGRKGGRPRKVAVGQVSQAQGDGVAQTQQ